MNLLATDYAIRDALHLIQVKAFELFFMVFFYVFSSIHARNLNPHETLSIPAHLWPQKLDTTLWLRLYLHLIHLLRAD